MSYLDQLATQLTKKVYINSMPSTVTPGVALMGKLSGDLINYELPGYRKTGFQVIVRAVNREVGLQLINEVIGELTFTNREVGDIYFNYSRPRHDPVEFPAGDSKNIEFSVNFDVCFVIV